MTTVNIPQQQPLLIPSIILEVLNYLPTVELKRSCRIVCKVWYEEANRVLRKRHALKVYLTNYDTLNEYFQAGQAQKEIFSEFHFGVRLQLKDPRIQRFFTQFGPFLTSLDLGKSQWPNASLRKILAENLPNLEELSMQLLIPKGFCSSGTVSPVTPSEPPTNFQFEDPRPQQPLPQPQPEPQPQYAQQQQHQQGHLYSNNNNNNSNSNINPNPPYQNWSYPTPPPVAGDYYHSSFDQSQGQAGYNNGHAGPTSLQSQDWSSYSSNLPPPGEWQNSFNSTGHYPSPTQYNQQTYGYTTSHNANGEWHYSQYTREWYWNTRVTPYVPPPPAPSEYNNNRGFGQNYNYHYQQQQYPPAPAAAPAHVPAHTPAHVPAHTPAHVPAHTPAHAPAHTPAHVSAHTPAHVPAHTPAHVPAHTPAHGPAYAHMPTYTNMTAPPHAHFARHNHAPTPEGMPHYYQSYGNGYSTELEKWNPNPPVEPYNTPDPYHWDNFNGYSSNLLNPNGRADFNPIVPPQSKFPKWVPPTIPIPSPVSPASTETHNSSALPKMKRLNFSIDYNLSWNQEQREGMKTFFRDLMTGMPNLEKISCSKFPTSDDKEMANVNGHESNLMPLLEVISEPNGPPLSRLKCLDIPLKNWSKVHRLGERFPLETLEWNIPKDLNFKKFYRSVMKLSPTLTKLEMDFARANSELLACLGKNLSVFKSLEKLKHMKLISYKGSLGFVLRIPALEILTLDVSKPDFEVLFDSQHFKNRMKEEEGNGTLHTLIVCNSKTRMLKESSLTSNVIRRISKAFPALQNLELEFIGDEALRGIFTSFIQLENLKISDGLFSDAFFIGLSPKCLAAYNRNKIKNPKLKDPVREYSYIGSLKHLKKLDICSKYLTDVSVFYGILNCRNLTSLTLRAYGVTNASLVRIADEMNLVSLKTIYCHQLTTIGANYVKERMPQTHLSLNEYEGSLTEKETSRLFRIGIGYKVTIPRRKDTKIKLEEILKYEDHKISEPISDVKFRM